MPAGGLGWALDAEFAFAWPWLLVLPTRGKPVYLGRPQKGRHQPCLGVDATKAGATQNVVPRLRLCDQASPEMGRDYAVPWQG